MLPLPDLQRLALDCLDSLPEVTLVTDANGYVLMANAAALRFLHAAGLRKVLGVHLRVLGARLMPLERMPGIVSHFEARPRVAGTLELEGRDGRAYLLRARPRLLAGGDSDGWIVSLADVHALRQARRQRDDALRFISHDMRSPQSSILSLIELYERGAQETRNVDRLLERIRRYARLGLALSEDFLQLARAEAGRVDLQDNDLYGLLDEAVDPLWDRARERDIRIAVPASEDDQGASCRVDRALITRALHNLLDNAVKFSAEGSEIQCSIEPLSLDGVAGWQIAVRDQGPGLTVGEVELLFEKFRRQSAPGAPQIEGFGLGLTFVRAAVHAHGGRITALNCAEQGAEFRVWLPQAPQRADSATDH